MHDIGRVANLFGAAALAAVGEMTAAAAQAAGGGLSAAAALVTLASEPGIGVTELSRRIGLSQPGATRLIESLASRGLVLSEAAPGSRSVALRLTGLGREKARLILAERERVLAELLAPLGGDALRDLDAALSAVLERATEQGAPPNLTCRLCDEQACVAVAACPVDRAWRRGRSC